MARNTRSTSKMQSVKTEPQTKPAAGAVKKVTAETKAGSKVEASKKQTATKAAVKKTQATKPLKAKTKSKSVKAKSAVKPRTVSALPKGYHTVTPSLIVRGAASAIEFYAKVFGAKELKRTLAADGITILNATLKIGNSIIQISDEMPAYGILSATSMGAATGALQLYLEDVDDAWARATEALSTIVMPLEDVYWGERTGKLIDPFGQVWILSKKIENLTEKEIQARYEALVTVVDTVEVSEMNDEQVTLVDISQAIANEVQKPECASTVSLAG